MELIQTLRRRIVRHLQRCGRLPRDEIDEAGANTDEGDEPLLALISAASAQARDTKGKCDERIGRHSDVRPLFAPGQLCCDVDGFSFHAKVEIPEDARERLERLCRYMARPPIASDRLSIRDDGKVLHRLRRHWRDGTSAVAFDPLTLLERLAALVPRPRTHLLTCHGVLASASPLRDDVVPLPRSRRARPGEPTHPPPSTPAARKRFSWAESLRRVFAFDVPTCPDCGGPRKLIAMITDGLVVRKILEHIGLSADPPPLAPARVPDDPPFDWQAPPSPDPAPRGRPVQGRSAHRAENPPPGCSPTARRVPPRHIGTRLSPWPWHANLPGPSLCYPPTPVEGLGAPIRRCDGAIRFQLPSDTIEPREPIARRPDLRMTARTSHVVLVAIASLALGVLIGALVAGGIDDVMASAPPMSPASPAGAPEAVPPPSIASPRLDAAPPSELRVLASAAARGKDLPVAPAAKTDDASGDAGVEASAVTGSIATLDGSPVAGVELELEPPEDAPKYRVRRATSDASGRFEFSGLPRGVWRVIGRHREYVLQRRNAFPELVPTGYHVELVASPAVTVDVRVTGEGAERARVAFRRPGSGEPEWSTWTSTSTVLALSPGAWELCASVDALDDWPSDRSWKLAPLASPVRTVHVGGGEAEVVTLLLEGARCLYGKVRLPEGHQSSDSHDTEPRVRLIEARTGTRADFETEDDRLTRSAEVDEEGRYGFFALPYERWTAGVALRWSSPGTVDVVDVVGLTRFDLEESIDGDGSVVVDAFTSGGHRITVGISFSFIHRDAGDGSDDYRWQGARTVLDADGALRVTPLPLDKDEREEVAKKDELLLRATLPGFARIDQPLAGLTGERFRLTFVPGAELEVVLVGDGAERAMRKCNGELKGEEYHDWVSFDEGAGALTFAGLLPGTYTLTVSTWGSYDGGWRQVRLHHGEVDVRAGSQRIEVQMPVRADLVVRCPGVKKDVGALLYGPLSEPVADREETWRRTRANAKVDDFGQATFKDIAAGRYRLTIGQRMQLVTVPCPPVDFEGRIPERHYFSLEKGDSPLRRAGIRSGDVYVALDGEEVTSQAALTRIRELSSQSAGTLRVTVERDGRWVEFTLDAAALGEDESFATQLEPMLE